MTTKPPFWDLEKLLTLPLESTRVWCTQSCVGVIREIVPFTLAEPFTKGQVVLTDLIVVGGGYFIDRAKIWCAEEMPSVRLVAIPSLWGSGAEVSPICVLMDENGHKKIHIDEKYIPEAVVIVEELAKSLDQKMMKAGSGDCWSHVMEAFLSPLANDLLRNEAAGLIREMLDVGFGRNPAWFRFSGRACALQAQCSVGLVHGIAHILEGRLKNNKIEGLGHAALCSLFMLPVMKFNALHSDKFNGLCAEFKLDQEKLFSVFLSLFDDEKFDSILPILEDNWRNIMLDPCSRTNSVLVRPKSLEFFKQRKFL